MAATAEPLADTRRRAIARLNIIKHERDLDDDTWRDLVEREAGQRSLRALSTQALLDLIKRIGGKTAPAPRSKLAGPYAGKLQALWISGYHLGLVADRGDGALLSFVKRQTGLDHVRFLREARAATAAIEGLRQWLARDGGVDWTEQVGNPRACVVAAQWRLLLARGEARVMSVGDNAAAALARYAQTVTAKAAPHFFTEEDWDAVIRALGKKIRSGAQKRARAA